MLENGQTTFKKSKDGKKHELYFGKPRKLKLMEQFFFNDP